MSEELVQTLKDIGFEEKEAKVYLALLKLGSSPASKIGEHLGYDRTTTYYLLLRMFERGYASQIFKGNVRYFTATEPKQILLLLKQRDENFEQQLPELEAISKSPPSDLKVEAHRGKEGLNLLYRDIINTGGELLAFGVDESIFIDFDAFHFKQYLKYVDAGKIKERLLTFEGAKAFGSKKSEYRFIKKEFFNPAPVAIYGDKVAVVIWEPSLHIILIESKKLADAFRKHFELLWNIAGRDKRKIQEE